MTISFFKIKQFLEYMALNKRGWIVCNIFSKTFEGLMKFYVEIQKGNQVSQEHKPF